MASAQDIIDRARYLVNDEVGAFASSLRWTNSEILQWITDAQREIVKLQPEANAVADVFEPEAGKPRQRLTQIDAYKLIRVEANSQDEG